MTHIAEHTVDAPSIRSPLRRPVRRRRQGCRDARWPAVAAALDALHDARRRSVRIVDADCDGGTLLICAARYARSLGFTAIEARGIDGSSGFVDHARAAAVKLRDPAIGITFEASDVISALEEEADFPADIVLWHGGTDSGDKARAVASAGLVRIAEPGRGA